MFEGGLQRRLRNCEIDHEGSQISELEDDCEIRGIRGLRSGGARLLRELKELIIKC